MEPVAGVPAVGRSGRAGPRGRYGIDGGYAGLAVFGVIEAGLAGAVVWAARRRRPAIAGLAGAGGAVVAGSAASYLYSTGPGKRAIWAQLLDELGLRGDEHVLDVGCGRGAVLMAAARRLPAGRAVGADIWRRRDQSGNSRAAAQRNAVAEGVRGRVELVDADARDLPFAPGSFEVVVSSLAAGVHARRGIRADPAMTGPARACEHGRLIQRSHFRRTVTHALSLPAAAATRTRIRRSVVNFRKQLSRLSVRPRLVVTCSNAE